MDRARRARGAGGVLVATLAVLGAAACAARPPRNIDDGCALLEDKRGWYRATKRSEDRWGTPVAVQLAIVHQESRFRADARPPRRKILGFIPGSRPSDAAGYAQALEATWREYEGSSGNGFADRDDFADAIDFVGWYTARSARRHGFQRDDAYNLYLAYHDGDGGYRRGTYRRKPWLAETARTVARRADTYRRQLSGCEHRLDRAAWWQFWR
jgi:hypothetical protein